MSTMFWLRYFIFIVCSTTQGLGIRASNSSQLPLMALSLLMMSWESMQCGEVMLHSMTLNATNVSDG